MTRFCINGRKSRIIVPSVFGAILLICWACLAAAQTPIPLPTDPSLAAYASVSGNFQNQLGETKRLTMSVWMTAYTQGQPIDFATMSDNAFETLGLPDQDNWGYFTSVDNTLTFNIRITDSKNRLGDVRIRENDTGKLVADIPANAMRNEIQGTFANDETVREYVATVYDATGSALSVLAIDGGKFDAWAWFSVSGCFEPFCPQPLACSQFTPVSGVDYMQVVGDPNSAPGVISGLSGTNSAKGCATLDVTNDSSAELTVDPPGVYLGFQKRRVILDSVQPSGIHFGSVADAQSLQSLVASLTQQDPTRVLSPVDLPPYSKGYGYWTIAFTGEVTSILAVPFERLRHNGVLDFLSKGINIYFVAKSGNLLSSGLLAASDTYLSSSQNNSGFKKGDVIALGDIYTLVAAPSTQQSRNPQPILQDVSFQLVPDIAPPGGMGQITISNTGYWTSVTPPGPANGGTLNLPSPDFFGTLSLPKGFKWEAKGCIQSPCGYQSINQPIQFQSPSVNTIQVPCVLTMLLQLKIYTSSASGPMGVPVQVLNSQGQVVSQGASVRQGDGKYAFSAACLAPGNYTAKAYLATSGGIWSGNAPVTVQKGISQEISLQIGFTPVGHP
jgi:hypothetical protein